MLALAPYFFTALFHPGINWDSFCTKVPQSFSKFLQKSLIRCLVMGLGSRAVEPALTISDVGWVGQH